MEGLGPSAGGAKRLDVVLASSDAFAADTVACQLMGTDARQIPHLRIGAERGYGVIDVERISISPENWRDWITPFAAPPGNLSIEFPNVTVFDNNSCSACQSTLLLFLNRFRDRLFDYMPGQQSLNIAIGKGNADLPEGSLCVGNCTLPQQGQGIFVPGCPPVGSQIIAAISGEAPDDGKDGDED
jgi:hypothetical protein